MASSAPGPTILDNIPARPPTPPREPPHMEPSEILLKSLSNRPSPLNPRHSLQTPPNANALASAAIDSGDPGSSRTKKRVGWSGCTEYKEAPKYTNGDKLYTSSPLAAPSSMTPKPLKSILKPSPSPNPLDSSTVGQLNGDNANINISEMLDSTIKQLAGSDRDSKLDAYMMLTRALKTSNNLPDRVALQNKMSLLTQFIQRDITSKNGNGTLDTSLVNHALTLLVTFLSFGAIGQTIPSDFAVFITDHSIRTFEDASSTKDMVRHFMHVVATQSFPPKVMTADRVGRLVTTLHKIEEKLNGKSIVMGRLRIYRNLIDNSRNYMVLHADWLKDVLVDMMSNIKDIRSFAISTGMAAAFALRLGHQMTRKVTEILLTSDGEQTYVQYYIHRLKEMAKDKQRSSSVPQIWSVVTLFLRCPLDRWDYYAPWLSLIQASFNTSDSQTKHEANYAWNRYMYLSLLNSKPTPKLLSTLCQPLLSQLRRKTSLKQPEESKKLRQTVIKGICTLYYYAFRPGADRNTSPDLAWDAAVQPVLSIFLGLDGTREAQSDDVLQASRIMVGLLDVSTPSFWNQDRIQELPPIAPDELPSIDSKWIRKNSERIFYGLVPIMEKNFMDMANKESLTYRLWKAIVGSVAAASAKDIKVSEDTARFFAYTFGLLSKTWAKGCPSNEELLATKFYPSVRNFIQILVGGLGLLPFTEKRLSMTVSNTFEPVATPSHRTDRPDRGVIRNPLQHLFAMLSSLPPGGSDDDAFSDFFQSAFEPFFVGKSEKVRLELTRELLRLLPQSTLSPFALWNLGAQAIRVSLLNPAPQSASAEEKFRGPEFREVASFLGRGLTSYPNLPSDSWLALFEAFSQHVAAGFGDAGRDIIVVEPLAKNLVDELPLISSGLSAKTLVATQAIISTAKFPRDRQALDAAKRRLWGAPAAPSKSSSVDPFDNLYKLINRFLGQSYNHLDKIDSESTIAALAESVRVFVGESHASNGFRSLFELQAGLCPWLEDGMALLKPNDENPLYSSICELWTTICNSIRRAGTLEKAQFDEVEGLLIAAFKSKHRVIINMAGETWNAIVKDEESLDCSDSLKSVVSSFRSKVDVAIPGSGDMSGEFGAQATSFLGNQGDANHTALSTGASNMAAASAKTPITSPAKISSQKSSTRKRRLEATPDVPSKRTSKRETRSSRTSTPRLRHDNSQIQFQPVVSSSPAPDESQHLTERQKEIRERQKENAALYSDGLSNSPLVSTASGVQSHESVSVSDAPGEITPKRATAYEELISSTPTPRRGQLIPMDIDNEPPSSPPEPRPYPLLSEIRSRSKNSSLENWDFSSPPGSPVPSRQQAAYDAEPAQVALTDDSTQAKAFSQPKKRRTRSSKKRSPSPDVVLSSLPERASHTGVRTRRSKRQEALAEDPSTPKQVVTALSALNPSTPKSGDDEFVDARSSPEQPSPGLSVILPPQLTAKDTSFALSEGDESHLMRFVTELEAKKDITAFEQGSSLSKLNGEEKEVSITVQGNARSSVKDGTGPTASLDLELGVIPSTQPEVSIIPPEDSPSSQASKKRKRKRGIKTDNRRKKKKSMEPAGIVETEEDQSQAPDVASSPLPPAQDVKSSPVAGVKTRRSARKQKERSISTEQVEAEQSEDKDGGNTDEELLSQLVTESNTPHEDSAPAPAPLPPTIEDSMDVESADQEVPRGKVSGLNEEILSEPVEEAVTGVISIMERLKGGLDGLRNASLSRTEVYQIEDMLMDMKRELFEAERRGRQSE